MGRYGSETYSCRSGLGGGLFSVRLLHGLYARLRGRDVVIQIGESLTLSDSIVSTGTRSIFSWTQGWTHECT